MIKITLEADLPRQKFQEGLGDDQQGGDQPFDLVDAILWEMDYGESATGGEPSTHNGIKITCDDGEQAPTDGKDFYQLEGEIIRKLEAVVKAYADGKEYSSLGQWNDDYRPCQEILFKMNGKQFGITFGEVEEI